MNALHCHWLAPWPVIFGNSRLSRSACCTLEMWCGQPRAIWSMTGLCRTNDRADRNCTLWLPFRARLGMACRQPVL